MQDSTTFSKIIIQKKKYTNSRANNMKYLPGWERSILINELFNGVKYRK